MYFPLVLHGQLGYAVSPKQEAVIDCCHRVIVSAPSVQAHPLPGMWVQIVSRGDGEQFADVWHTFLFIFVLWGKTSGHITWESAIFFPYTDVNWFDK